MKRRIVSFATVFSGAFVLAFSLSFFFVPLKVTTGGLGGVATLFYYFFSIPLFLTTLILNLILFFFAGKSLQRGSLWKNLFGILSFSFFLRLLEGMDGFQGDLFLSSLFGGVLSGVGVALALREDASTGGTDLAALVLSKHFPYLSPAFFINLMDTVIILVSGLLFENGEITLYSLLALFISNFVVDRLLVRGDSAKAVTVISGKSDEIVRFIQSTLSRGVTAVPVRLCFSGREGEMLFCVLRRRQAFLLLEKIGELDPDAFTVVSEVKKVQGRGFSRDL